MPSTRRVNFNSTVEVHEIMGIDDFTASEISALWYNEAEMHKISQKCLKVLHKNENRKSKNRQKYCVRGLEGHSRLGSISKRNARISAFEAVLEEQARQHKNQETDVQAIADVYKRTTTSSQMWAQVVGNRDEKAVEAYLCEGDDEEETAMTTPPALVSTSSKQLQSPESPLKRRVSATPYSPIARAA